MENIFKVKVNKYLPAKLEIKKFSGGETQAMFHNPSTSDEGNVVELFALIRDGDIIPLALVVDAIRREIKSPIINLHLPYLPYARQDRVMNKGESLAIKVYCDFINSLNFNSIKVDDCHSDVTAFCGPVRRPAWPVRRWEGIDRRDRRPRRKWRSRGKFSTAHCPR